MQIEPLESRIAPAVLTYIDVDGDLATIRTSKGTIADLVATGVLNFSAVDPLQPRQLQAIDLSLNPVFAGTNLTITAKRGPTGGDGFANIGYIDATGSNGGTALDLGAVSIDGDLGQIDAGDGTASTAAIKKLTLHSLGVFGLSTQAGGGSLLSDIVGAIGALKVGGSIRDATINVNGGNDGDIRSIVIGGSLLGGTAPQGGRIVVSGDLGPINIGGNIEGGTQGFSATSRRAAGNWRASESPGRSSVGVAVLPPR